MASVGQNEAREMSNSFDKHFGVKAPERHKVPDSFTIPKDDPTFVQYIRERDEAREELRLKNDELTKYKSKNYDLNNEIEELKSQISLLKEEKELKKTVTSVTKTMTKKAKGMNKKDSNKEDEQPSVKNKIKIQITASTPTSNEHHPIIPGMDHITSDSFTYYSHLAQLFPNMRLSVLIDAEKKFCKADENKDGTIDCNELEKMLTTSSTMFTKKQVQEILKEVDKDNTGTLDFIESLTIIDKLYQPGKKTNLPASVANNKSTMCLIQ
ncbi:unnamed protein product [Owenia fusiformis]|uniref:Uncharacterized protein n=1 Tax=Owenia fusiformis TaxID=6347 RepID=A0A8J1U5R9_OWEFU|nr:unnamed protein product [Owenia fusiformis]